MELVLAVLTGGLVARGVYLMLRRNLVRLLFGLMLISNAINLLIFTSGGLTRGRPALIPTDAQQSHDLGSSILRRGRCRTPHRRRSPLRLSWQHGPRKAA